jgi:hypothetical protein
MNYTTPALLSAYETCARKGYYTQLWRPDRLTANEILLGGMKAGLMEGERKDFGEVAGETVMDLAVSPGMEMPTSRHLHDSVVHHAALADMLTSALRTPGGVPWGQPPPTRLGGLPWASNAFLDPSGAMLRRVALVSNWNDDRHYQELRSWYSLGEVVAYDMPMTIAVMVLGQHRDGRRSGPFTRGFLHPNNHKLRFRKKAKVTSETFSDRWEQVWREDRDEIGTRQWLQGMLDDDILRDVCFTIELPVPGKLQADRIRDMAARKLETLAKTTATPPPSLSVCDRPPCPFKSCCWSLEPHEPSVKAGYIVL